MSDYRFDVTRHKGIDCLQVFTDDGTGEIARTHIPLEDLYRAVQQYDALYVPFTRKKDDMREEKAAKPTNIEQAKPEVDFERLEWYAYILKRAIANHEPLTAWDACASIMAHFENVYGRASGELEKERLIDGLFINLKDHTERQVV